MTTLPVRTAPTMSEIITAVYSNGMLRPQNPLSLTDGQTVRIQVLTEEADETEQIIQSLVAAGLVTPSPYKGRFFTIRKNQKKINR